MTAKATLLITSLLITYSIKLSQTASCIPANYARFRDLLSEGRSSSSLGTRHPGRFFTTAYTFGCHGVITEWAAYTVNNGSHPIEFHVWRVDETLQNVYHLIGINIFQDAQPDDSRLIFFQVPPEEQIMVMPGDFVGIRTVEQPGSSDEGFAIQFDRGDPGTHRQYFRGGIPPNADESFSTPTLLDLRLPTANFSSLELMDALASIPVIRATVLQFGSNSTTVTTSSSSDPQSTIPQSTTQPIVPLLPQSTIIAIAVGGNVLILAIIIVVVMCCVLCNRSRKRKNKQIGNGGQLKATQVPLVNNLAYNVGNNRDWFQNNPAYNHQLMNNPAYNYNSDTDPYYSVIQN